MNNVYWGGGEDCFKQHSTNTHTDQLVTSIRKLEEHGVSLHRERGRLPQLVSDPTIELRSNCDLTFTAHRMYRSRTLAIFITAIDTILLEYSTMRHARAMNLRRENESRVVTRNNQATTTNWCYDKLPPRNLQFARKLRNGGAKLTGASDYHPRPSTFAKLLDELLTHEQRLNCDSVSRRVTLPRVSRSREEHRSRRTNLLARLLLVLSLVLPNLV